MRLLHAHKHNRETQHQQLSLRVRVFLDRMDCKQPTLLRSASPGPVVLCVAADGVRHHDEVADAEVVVEPLRVGRLMLMQP